MVRTVTSKLKNIVMHFASHGTRHKDRVIQSFEEGSKEGGGAFFLSFFFVRFFFLLFFSFFFPVPFFDFLLFFGLFRGGILFLFVLSRVNWYRHYKRILSFVRQLARLSFT